MRHRFLREKVEDGSIKLSHISSADNIADSLTKSLPADTFSRLCELLGAVIRLPVRGGLSETGPAQGNRLPRLHVLIRLYLFSSSPYSSMQASSISDTHNYRMSGRNKVSTSIDFVCSEIYGDTNFQDTGDAPRTQINFSKSHQSPCRPDYTVSRSQADILKTTSKRNHGDVPEIPGDAPFRAVRTDHEVLRR
jgi:hypothetical protein